MSERHNHDSDYTAPTVDVDHGKLRRIALLAAVVGTIAFVALGLVNLTAYGATEGTHEHGQEHGGIRDFFLTYQVGFIYWLSLPVGGMTLLLLSYLTSASWGLVLRRFFQAATRTWPMMAVLFMPVAASLFMGEESSFWWAVEAKDIDFVKDNQVAIEEIAHKQHIYLNWPGFMVRATVVFLVFGLIMRGIRKWSPKAEDEGDEVYKNKLLMLGGPGVVAWALLFTVGITDWVMSVEPTWASTMFPVVAGLNCLLTAFAFCTFLFYTIVGKNQTVLDIVKDKFRIDIGSLTLAFTMIWSYASFCQFMLIWAGNIPEEIGYYKRRLNGGWEYMAYALMIVHWFLPFIILLFREVKTDPQRMRKLTMMLLAICAIDVIWWIVPSYPHVNGYLHVPMAIAAVVGIGGIWGLSFTKELAKSNILPKKDTAFLANWGHH